MKQLSSSFQTLTKGVATIATPLVIAIAAFTLVQWRSAPVYELFVSDGKSVHETTWSQIDQLQSRNYKKTNPEELISLGALYLQAARESTRTDFYSAALGLAAFLEKDPLTASAGLSLRAQVDLIKHDFLAAYKKSKELVAQEPQKAHHYGSLVDSLIELGRYQEAEQALELMIAIKPDSNTFTRAAYLREIYGDLEGAIELMERAIINGSPNRENTAWNYAELGRLWRDKDDEKSLLSYKRALETYPGFIYAQEGLAHHLKKQGNTKEAQRILQDLLDSSPLPQFAAALGDLEKEKGNQAAAELAYRVVEIGFESIAESGTDVRAEEARFQILRERKLERSLDLAREVYQEKPTIYNADTLAWGYHLLGEQEKAEEYLEKALRTDTADLVIREHEEAIKS